MRASHPCETSSDQRIRIKQHADEIVSDEALSKREERWTTDVPDTKEAYLIREIFDGENHFMIGH